MAQTGVTRTSIQLYRDCLRLVKHVAGKSPKGQKLNEIVRGEFHKNRAVEDATELENLKTNAIRALSNYLVYESAQSDPRMMKHLAKDHDDPKSE